MTTMEASTPNQASDQAQAETSLELTDLQADCRLREIEPARCSREAALLDDLEESP